MKDIDDAQADGVSDARVMIENNNPNLASSSGTGTSSLKAAKTATAYGEPFDKPEKLHGSEQPQHPGLDDNVHANDNNNNGASLDLPRRFNDQDNGGDEDDDDEDDDDDDGEDGRMELLSKRHEELRRQLADLMREQELEMEQRRKEARSKKKKKKKQQQSPAVPLVIDASASAPTLGDMSGGSGGGSQAHSPIHADADSWKTPGRGEQDGKQDGSGHHDDEFVDASSSTSASTSTVGPSATATATATTPAAKTSVRGGLADGSYSAREVRLMFICMRSELFILSRFGDFPSFFVRSLIRSAAAAALLFLVALSFFCNRLPWVKYRPS